MSPRRVLIGGVGYRWQRDGSFGLVVVDELAGQAWPDGVEVADLGYGALFVTQDLADAQPRYERLVLLAGVRRGREPGRLYVRRWEPWLPDATEIQERVREAGAGILELDHLLIIAHYFGALPGDVVLVEAEPVSMEGGIELSPAVATLLPRACEVVRSEAVAPPRQAVAAGPGVLA